MRRGDPRGRPRRSRSGLGTIGPDRIDWNGGRPARDRRARQPHRRAPGRRGGRASARAHAVPARGGRVHPWGRRFDGGGGRRFGGGGGGWRREARRGNRPRAAGTAGGSSDHEAGRGPDPTAAGRRSGFGRDRRFRLGGGGRGRGRSGRRLGCSGRGRLRRRRGRRDRGRGRRRGRHGSRSGSGGRRRSGRRRGGGRRRWGGRRSRPRRRLRGGIPAGDAASREEAQRIEVALGLGRHAHAEVDVRAGPLGVARRPDGADRGALVDPGTPLDRDRAEVDERDRVAVGGRDRHGEAVAGQRPGEGDRALPRSAYGLARHARKVDAPMLAARVRVGPEAERPEHLARRRPGPRAGRRRGDHGGCGQEDRCSPQRQHASHRSEAAARCLKRLHFCYREPR
jgi:hypothetical protein